MMRGIGVLFFKRSDLNISGVKKKKMPICFFEGG